MRWRLGVIIFAVVGGSVGLSASATPPRPNLLCSLPGMVVCLGATDPQCTQFGAFCDAVTLVCTCSFADMGDGGNGNGDGPSANPTDFATSTPPSNGGGTNSTGPPVGGGMSGAPKTGCSFVPGSAS